MKYSLCIFTCGLFFHSLTAKDKSIFIAQYSILKYYSWYLFYFEKFHNSFRE